MSTLCSAGFGPLRESYLAAWLHSGQQASDTRLLLWFTLLSTLLMTRCFPEEPLDQAERACELLLASISPQVAADKALEA